MQDIRYIQAGNGICTVRIDRGRKVEKRTVGSCGWRFLFEGAGDRGMVSESGVAGVRIGLLKASRKRLISS